MRRRRAETTVSHSGSALRSRLRAVRLTHGFAPIYYAFVDISLISFRIALDGTDSETTVSHSGSELRSRLGGLFDALGSRLMGGNTKPSIGFSYLKKVTSPCMRYAQDAKLLFLLRGIQLAKIDYAKIWHPLNAE